MNTFWNSFRAMVCDSSGATLVEYALTLMLFSSVSVAGFMLIVNSTVGVYSTDSAGYDSMQVTQQTNLP